MQRGAGPQIPITFSILQHDRRGGGRPSSARPRGNCGHSQYPSHFHFNFRWVAWIYVGNDQSRRPPALRIGQTEIPGEMERDVASGAPLGEGLPLQQKARARRASLAAAAAECMHTTPPESVSGREAQIEAVPRYRAPARTNTCRTNEVDETFDNSYLLFAPLLRRI